MYDNHSHFYIWGKSLTIKEIWYISRVTWCVKSDSNPKYLLQSPHSGLQYYSSIMGLLKLNSLVGVGQDFQSVGGVFSQFSLWLTVSKMAPSDPDVHILIQCWLDLGLFF